MATTKITLTTTWQELTAYGFVGQMESGETLLLRNDTESPTAGDAFHEVNDTENLQYPAPATGSWYARVPYGESDITITEV